MSPVKTYDVEINGVKTRMKLDEAGAKRYGVWKTAAPEVATTPTVKKVASKKGGAK